MKKYASILLAVIAAFVLAGCGEKAPEEAAAPTSYNVEYYVLMNSPGMVKITYKDPSGQEIIEPAVGAPTVGTTWEKVFDFGASVDSMLHVELSADGPDDPVGCELYIAINGERIQKATKFITRSNTMKLAVKLP